VTERTLVVVNPMSAGGKTGRQWPLLRQALVDAGVDFEYRLTSRAGEATELCRAGLREGVDRVVAVGGDGTLNEVLNGFFDAAGEPVAPRGVLGLLPSGTGGDFRRSVGIPLHTRAAAALIARGDRRRVDVGRIDYAGDGRIHHFINIADCGIGGEVVNRVNRSGKAAGGKATFLYHSLAALVRFPGRLVRVDADGEVRERRLSNVVVANGRYFGGSMLIAPDADVSDGVFDVILVDRVAWPKALAGMRHLYDGSHVRRPGIEVLRGRRVTVTPLEDAPVLFDVEGEQVGQAPATLTCLAGAVEICAPAAGAASRFGFPPSGYTPA